MDFGDLPPVPARNEINDMVSRVEKRAMAMIETDDYTWMSVDPYYMKSPEDSTDWMCLYSKAQRVSQDFANVIWYIRGVGTRLQKNPRWGYVLVPDIQRGGWESEEHWNRDKHRLLDRYSDYLVDILGRLGNDDDLSGTSVYGG